MKPGNILLASDARSSSDHAFLSDFGVTKRLETGAGITRTGQFVGTVDYVAPEQIRGGDVDGRADVYSLGCVLYRCLTGEVPFPRDTEVATIYAHLQDPPPVPSERLPELGVGFDAPIARALAKRPPTASTRAAISPMRPAPSSIPTRWPSRRVVPPEEPPQPRTSRRRVAFVSGGLAVVAGVAIVALLLFTPRRRWDAAITFTLGLAEPTPELTWSAADVGLAAPGDQEIADAAVVDGTIVAVGHDDAGGNRNAAAWTSSDGKRWTQASGTSLGTTGEQRMDAVATKGGEVVGVGSERTGGDLDAAVWRSADRGTSWDRVEGATSGLHEAGDQAMQVVVRGHTRRRGGGLRDRSRGDLDAAVWTSKDGSSWTRLTQAPLTGPGDQEIFGATTMRGPVDRRRIVDVGGWRPRRGGVGQGRRGMDGYRRLRVAPGDQQIDAVVASDDGTRRGGVVRLGRKRRRRGLDVQRRIGWDRVPASARVRRRGGSADVRA